MRPFPDINSQVDSVDRQYGHIGWGGKRSRRQAAQACMRSSPALVAAQNGAESSSGTGSRNSSSTSTFFRLGFRSGARSAPEQQGAGRHRLARGHQAGLCPFDLSGGASADLADAFDDQVEAVDVGLRQAAAGGVDRQSPA